MAKKNTTKKLSKFSKKELSIMANAFGDNDSTLCGQVANVAEYEEVVHPSHYNGLPNGVECWDVTEHFPANIAMSMKHLWRCGSKPGNDAVKDLDKAIQYLERQRKLLLGQTNKM